MRKGYLALASMVCILACMSCREEEPVDVDRMTALSNKYTPLHMAALKCDAAKAESILRSGTTDIGAKAVWDETALHIAAKQTGCAAVIRLLVKHGAAIEAEGTHRTRPLHHAAAEGDVENIRALLDAGASIKAAGNAVVCGNCYRTPLETAIEAKKTANALYLISRGAKINTVSIYALKPEYYISWAMENSTRASRTVHGSPSRFNHDELSPLQAAAILGDIDIVSALLEKGARINGNPGRGATPLALAAWHGHARLVETLLERGALPDTSDGQARTALHYALENRRDDIAKKLLEAGAAATPADLFGTTPLHLAARTATGR
jgi:ankyrin repeat protein